MLRPAEERFGFGRSAREVEDGVLDCRVQLNPAATSASTVDRADQTAVPSINLLGIRVIFPPGKSIVLAINSNWRNLDFLGGFVEFFPENSLNSLQLSSNFSEIPNFFKISSNFFKFLQRFVGKSGVFSKLLCKTHSNFRHFEKFSSFTWYKLIYLLFRKICPSGRVCK